MDNKKRDLNKNKENIVKVGVKITISLSKNRQWIEKIETTGCKVVWNSIIFVHCTDPGIQLLLLTKQPSGFDCGRILHRFRKLSMIEYCTVLGISQKSSIAKSLEFHWSQTLHSFRKLTVLGINLLSNSVGSETWLKLYRTANNKLTVSVSLHERSKYKLTVNVSLHEQTKWL